jgi:hypothetical protein
MTLAIAMLALAPAAANAQELAYVVFNGPYSDAELQRLDLETGELAPVGPVGHPVTHIAFDSEGLLFGVDAANDQLIAIDVFGGTGAVVGPLGVGIFDVWGMASGAGDRLWMAAWDDALGPSLYEIDRTTGEATRLFEISEQYFGSLAASDDTLFTASYSLAIVDTTTGSIEPIPSSSFGIWWARALDFDGSGLLRGLMLCGPCMTPYDVLIMLEIDHITGTILSDGPNEPHGTWGLAIFRGGLFLDGFEAGDASSWTAVVGAARFARCRVVRDSQHFRHD